MDKKIRVGERSSFCVAGTGNKKEGDEDEEDGNKEEDSWASSGSEDEKNKGKLAEVAEKWKLNFGYTSPKHAINGNGGILEKVEKDGITADVELKADKSKLDLGGKDVEDEEKESIFKFIEETSAELNEEDAPFGSLIRQSINYGVAGNVGDVKNLFKMETSRPVVQKVEEDSDSSSESAWPDDIKGSPQKGTESKENLANKDYMILQKNSFVEAEPDNLKYSVENDTSKKFQSNRVDSDWDNDSIKDFEEKDCVNPTNQDELNEITAEPNKANIEVYVGGAGDKNSENLNVSPKKAESNDGNANEVKAILSTSEESFRRTNTNPFIFKKPNHKLRKSSLLVSSTTENGKSINSKTAEVKDETLVSLSERPVVKKVDSLNLSLNQSSDEYLHQNERSLLPEDSEAIQPSSTDNTLILYKPDISLDPFSAISYPSISTESHEIKTALLKPKTVLAQKKPKAVKYPAALPYSTLLMADPVPLKKMISSSLQNLPLKGTEMKNPTSLGLSPESKSNADLMSKPIASKKPFLTRLKRKLSKLTLSKSVSIISASSAEDNSQVKTVDEQSNPTAHGSSPEPPCNDKEEDKRIQFREAFTFLLQAKQVLDKINDNGDGKDAKESLIISPSDSKTDASEVVSELEMDAKIIKTSVSKGDLSKISEESLGIHLAVQCTEGKDSQ